jgi:hypothetical protein
MSHLLRLALENDTTPEDDGMLTMSGPLSEIYTQALNAAYAKDEPLGAAMETQAIDAMVAAAAQRLQATPVAYTPGSHLTVYGVAQSAVSEDTVKEVSRALSEVSEPSEFVLILDATQPGINEAGEERQQRLFELNTALETLAQCHGAQVYGSLESFLTAHPMRPR